MPLARRELSLRDSPKECADGPLSSNGASETTKSSLPLLTLIYNLSRRAVHRRRDDHTIPAGLSRRRLRKGGRGDLYVRITTHP